MRNAVLPLALICLVVLSGCLGGIFDDRPQSDTPAGTNRTTTTNLSNSTTTGASPSTETGTATAVESRSNPWGDDPIVVGIQSPDTERDYTETVERATAYWESNAAQYAGYDVEYRVDPTAASPDIVVNFVDAVPACGDARDAVGCAPFVTDSRQIVRPEQVYVQTGLSTESTVLVLKHEFGHTLGLRHTDEPTDVMQAESVLYTQPTPNATERAFPWADPNFTVYVDYANVSEAERSETRQQIQHALTYYENGADGSVPSNLTFRFVDSPEAADVTVRFSETSPCGQGTGSCFRTFGPDSDGDGAIEQYTALRITLVDLDTRAVGWHVGNWLAYGLGMEQASEKPEPFRDADYRERRSEWWT